MKVMVYQTDTGVAVVYPSPECELSILQVADKDVPSGRNWRIMDTNELPSRDTRDQWRWTDSGPLAVDPPPTQT